MYLNFAKIIFVALLIFAAVAEAQKITAPRLLEKVTPVYPEALRAKPVDGKVTLAFDVDVEGRVLDPKVSRGSGHPELDAAALEAVTKFRFDPARDGGGAVRVSLTYTFSFKAPPRALRGALKVRLVEKGSRARAVGIAISAFSESAAGKEVTATTDLDGMALLRGLPAGVNRIVVKAPDYKLFEVTETITENEELGVRYLIERLSYDEYTTVVEESRVQETSRRILKTKDIFKAAGTQGDPIRVVQNLPGVARAPFGLGQLSIRGSAPQDSRYFFDDLEVPILFHFGGIRTVFNGDIIDHIDFLPGGFTSRYGEAVGGIVSSFTRGPRKDRYHLIADINTFDSQLLIEGPLAKNLSFYATGRRSYIDLILRALLKKSSGFSLLVAPRYYDYQTALEWKLSAKDVRTLQFYGADDALTFLLDKPADANPDLRGNFKFETSFHRMATHWKKSFAEGWTSQSRVSVGHDRIFFDTSNGPYFMLNSWGLGLRQEFEKELAKDWSLMMGATNEASLYKVNVKLPPATASLGGVQTPSAATTLLETSQRGAYSQGGVFSGVSWKPGPYVFIPSLRVDAGTVGDEVSADPRFSARRTLSENDAVKGSVGLFHQRPQPQESAKDLGNPDLRSLYAMQYVLGYEREIPWRLLPLTLDWQLFYRDLHRHVVAVNTARRYENTGSGYAAGNEVYLRYGARERLNGWLSYTLSKSRLRNGDNEPYYPFQNDQTHILTLITNIPLGDHWEFGFRFRYTTGNPVTPINDSSYNADGDAYAPIRGQYYSQRLPSFHQLDLRLEKKFIDDLWILTAYLEINNVYNRKNVEGVAYSYDYRSKEYIRGLPLLPTFGIRGEF